MTKRCFVAPPTKMIGQLPYQDGVVNRREWYIKPGVQRQVDRRLGQTVSSQWRSLHIAEAAVDLFSRPRTLTRCATPRTVCCWTPAPAPWRSTRPATTRHTTHSLGQQIFKRLPWALGCILQRSGNLWPSGNNIINLSKVVAWLSGRALVLIKVATLCLAQLILG